MSYQLSEVWLSVVSTLRFQFSVKEVIYVGHQIVDCHKVLTEY